MNEEQVRGADATRRDQPVPQRRPEAREVRARNDGPNGQTDAVETVRDGYRTADNLNARSQIYRFNEDPYPWQRRVFDHLALPPECQVLELGCGPGKLWLENADRLPPGWSVTLTDLSLGMLQEARRTLAGVAHRFSTTQADAQALPFAADGFDAVIANHMVYHVPNKPALFAEVRRVLRPGGRFYAATNGKGGDELAALFQRVDPAIQEAVVAEAATEMPLTHPTTYTLENGAEQLAPWFTEVTIHRFTGATAVPEVEPVVTYALSGPFYRRYLVGVKLATFRRLLAEEITTKGAFRMTGSTGIFEAVWDDR
jgi:ubiquinone/menaquinone biosynthesis C-methylase UbiE